MKILAIMFVMVLLTSPSVLGQEIADSLTISKTTSGMVRADAATIKYAENNIFTTSERYGVGTVVEFRAKFAVGTPEINRTIFGFLNTTKLRADAEDNRSVFVGFDSKLNALIATRSPDALETVKEGTNDGEFHRYKIYIGPTETKYWIDKTSFSTAKVLTYPQFVGIVPPNTTDGITIEHLSIYKNNSVAVTGLLPGVRVELLDEENRIKAEATAAGTVAYIDLSGVHSNLDEGRGVSVPFKGKFKFYAPNGALMSTVSAGGDVYGGDSYQATGIQKFTLNLKAGLNLIGSPVAENITLSEIQAACGDLVGIGQSGLKIAVYEPETKKWASSPEVRAGQGAWVKPSKNCDVAVIGRPFKGVVTLKTGFNIISSKGDLSSALGTCSGKLVAIGPKSNKQTVWARDADLNQWYNPTKLDSRSGYYVYLTKNSQSCCFGGTTCPTKATTTTTTTTRSKTTTTASTSGTTTGTTGTLKGDGTITIEVRDRSGNNLDGASVIVTGGDSQCKLDGFTATTAGGVASKGGFDLSKYYRITVTLSGYQNADSLCRLASSYGTGIQGKTVTASIGMDRA